LSTSTSRDWILVAFAVGCGALATMATRPPAPDVDGLAREVANGVSAASGLNAPCRKLALKLAEAGIRARIRLPHGALGQEELAAAEQWELARCPDRALPGITVGIAEAARKVIGGVRIGEG